MTVRLRNADSTHQWSAAPGLVMVVEDDPELRRGLRRLLEAAGHRALEASTRAEAHARLVEHLVEVIVLDLALPDGSGLEVLSNLRADEVPAIGVIVLTGSGDTNDVAEALRRGALSYLHKPVDPLTFTAQVQFALAQVRNGAAQRAAARDRESHWDRVNLLLEELPRSLALQLSRAWDLRHVETGAHVRRIAAFTGRLAFHLGLPRDEAESLGQASMLHDVGKIAIPDTILNKPGALTDGEFAIMKKHSVLGAELLGGLNHPFLQLAARIARGHHERWDGSGYPDGLIGTQCSRASRIVGVVDVYDALSQKRCYKNAWSRDAVLEFFLKQRGKLFDPELVDALLDLTPEFEKVLVDHPDSSGRPRIARSRS